MRKSKLFVTQWFVVSESPIISFISHTIPNRSMICTYQRTVEVGAVPTHIAYSTAGFCTHIGIFMCEKLLQEFQYRSPINVFIETLQAHKIQANKTGFEQGISVFDVRYYPELVTWPERARTKYIGFLLTLPETRMFLQVTNKDERTSQF